MIREECRKCHNKTVEALINKQQPDARTAENFKKGVSFILDQNSKVSNPKLAALIHRFASLQMNNHNLYQVEKSRSNRLIYSQYQMWRHRVDLDRNSLHMAIKLAVIGNIIDYGAHSVPKDVISHIDILMNKAFKIDQSDELILAIKNAKSILYLGDNAGEVVFDKLLIRTMRHSKVTFAVRGKAVLNDVTLEDANQIGMSEVAILLSNGSDAPSTLLDECSDEFKEVYSNADLIISKGQGNFEGLMMDKDPRCYFLLIAKCKPIAEMLDVNEGDLVVMKHI